MHYMPSLPRNTTSFPFIHSCVAQLFYGSFASAAPIEGHDSLALPDADAILLAFRPMEPKVQVPASLMASLHLIRVGRSLQIVCAGFTPSSLSLYSLIGRPHRPFPSRAACSRPLREGQSILVIVKSFS